MLVIEVYVTGMRLGKRTTFLVVGSLLSGRSYTSISNVPTTHQWRSHPTERSDMTHDSPAQLSKIRPARIHILPV